MRIILGIVLGLASVGQWDVGSASSDVLSKEYIWFAWQCGGDDVKVFAGSDDARCMVAQAWCYEGTNAITYMPEPWNAEPPFEGNYCRWNTVRTVRGDINLDGVVNVGDLQRLVASWSKQDLYADLNGDGYVNVGDLQVLVVNWGSANGHGE